MTRQRDVSIGLDLGTSSLKAVALDGRARALASAQAGYETSRPAPGRAEQSADDWIRALEEVVHRLAAAVPVSRWNGIGLAGMLPTLVTIDEAWEPVGPAITWEDTRAEQEGSALREAIGPEALYRTTGQWVDGRYLLPMLQWLMRCEAARAESTRTVLGAKDYLFLWLTGEVATDPSTATGYGCYDLQGADWSGVIAHLAGAVLPNEPIAGSSRPRLPPLRPLTYLAPLTPAAASRLGLPAGLPVSLGAADSVLGAVGLSATEPGQVAYIFGSSTVIMGVADRLLLDPGHRYLVTPLLDANCWGLEMDLVSTGSAIRWLARALRLARQRQIFELAGEVEPGAHDLTFLPFLGGGEQGALWDPTLRGALFGLTLGHTPADIARALLDGIILESRRCIRVLDEIDLPRGEILVAGHDLHPTFLQNLADATGRTVLAPATPHSVSAVGAARLAAAAEPNEGASRLGESSPPSGLGLKASSTDWDTGGRAAEVKGAGSRSTRGYSSAAQSHYVPRPERASLWDALSERNTHLLGAIRSAGIAPAPTA